MIYLRQKWHFIHIKCKNICFIDRVIFNAGQVTYYSKLMELIKKLKNYEQYFQRSLLE